MKNFGRYFKNKKKKKRKKKRKKKTKKDKNKKRKKNKGSLKKKKSPTDDLNMMLERIGLEANCSKFSLLSFCHCNFVFIVNGF